MSVVYKNARNVYLYSEMSDLCYLGKTRLKPVYLYMHMLINSLYIYCIVAYGWKYKGVHTIIKAGW